MELFSELIYLMNSTYLFLCLRGWADTDRTGHAWQWYYWLLEDLWLLPLAYRLPVIYTSNLWVSMYKNIQSIWQHKKADSQEQPAENSVHCQEQKRKTNNNSLFFIFCRNTSPLSLSIWEPRPCPWTQKPSWAKHPGLNFCVSICLFCVHLPNPKNAYK